MQRFRSIKKYPLIIAALVIAAMMIAGALWYRAKLQRDAQPSFDVNSILPADSNSSAKQSFTSSQLAAFDGKSGNKCYVAIDTTVYEIKQGTLWQNGQHVTSNGQAMCGQDFTAVIGKSPHGRSKLETLPKVGTYTP